MHFTVYEEKILNKLLTVGMESKDKARLKYGLYLVLDSLKKGCIVYLLAFCLGLVKETMLVHFSFLVVRQVSYGWHSSSKIGCLVGSIISFVGAPFLLSHMEISKIILIGISIIILLLTAFIGPIGTKISKLSMKKRLTLHNKLNRRLGCLFLLILITPFSYCQYIILGIGLQFILILTQYIKNKGDNDG